MEKLTEDIYFNCGVYHHDKNGDILFIAVPGYFASTAWCKSDEAYSKVSGTKFEGITADDFKPWLLERYNVRRLKDAKELEKLLENANPEFIKYFRNEFSD